MMKKNERGSALLLSLGILSLMLITGMAFLTNSLIARKNAFYNSSRNQAEFLGRMAINRAQGAVMLYQYQWRYNNTQDWLFTGFEEVVSHAVTDTSKENYIEVVRNGAADAAYNDGLDNDNSLKLPAALNGSKYYENLETADALRKPQWVYVTNGAAGNDKRVIGRYAFRVLPPLNHSRINLNAVLHKGLYANLLTAENSDSVLVAQSKNNDFAWLLNQIPVNESETAVKALTGVTVDNTNFKAVALTGDKAAAPRGKWYEDLVKPASNYVGDFNAFAKAWDLSDDQKTVMMKYFDDSPFPAHIEVYSYNNVLYHRFGLRQLKSSGTTILGKNVNSEAAVTALMTPAKVTDTKSVEKSTELAVEKLFYTTENGGIDFLNRICDTAANFPDVDAGDNTGLKLRRKQIAANLLDYCDGDSVPTSDKTASTWNVADNTTYPNYTGNEKTAYINELGLLLQLSAVQNAHAGNVLPSIDLGVKTRAFMELADIYKDALTGYSGKFFAKSLEFNVKVSGTASATITYMQGIETKTETITHDFDVTLTESGAKPFADADRTFNFDSFGTKADGYYAALSKASDDLAIPMTNKTISALQLFGTVPSPLTGVSDIRITVKSVRLNSVKFQPGAAMIASATEGNCDFAKFTGDPIEYGDISRSSLAVDVQDPGTVTPLCGFSLGGFECRDPRQNLFMVNPALQSNSEKQNSDWSITPKISFFSSLKNAFSINTDTLSLTDQTDISALPALTGKVNSVSNPHTPGTTIGNDLEVATDPAYLGDGYDKHISTAYIRNAPMQSAWELGAIHRGAPWQTINLKKAVATNNTLFSEGDGAILDEVKIFDEVRSFGKLNLPGLAKECSIDSAHALIFLKAWLGTMAPWKVWYDGATVVDAAAPTSIVIAEQLRIHFGEHPDVAPQERRSSALDDFLRMPTGCGTGTPLSSTNYSVPGTDAALEELAGKLIPMTEARPGLVTTFRVLVKAQTIKDIGNDDTPGSAKTVDRFKSDGTLVQRDVAYGRYDYDDNVTLDEITGEVYMLATFDRNPVTGAMKLRSVRHINQASDANQ